MKRLLYSLLLSPAALLAMVVPTTKATPMSARRLKSPSAPTAVKGTACPPEMALIGGRFCVDQFEATTVEVRADGTEVPHSPFLPVAGLRVRAVSQKSHVPQAYISRNEAEHACEESGKRLCSDEEWVTACKGPEATVFPYGNERKSGYCVDTNRVSPLDKIWSGLGRGRYQQAPMNDPRLNQVAGTLAPTGSFAHCTNSFQVYDMVGNVHEWTSDPKGTFRGGYYLDTRINGEGCNYRTVAHPATYHDYSTGFRCCAAKR